MLRAGISKTAGFYVLAGFIAYIFLFVDSSYNIASAQSAQHELCGPVPSLPNKLKTDEGLKGQLEGRARMLSGFLGKAELGGKVEATRKELYQSSDSFFAARQDAYMAYMFCVLIIGDKTASLEAKLRALQEFRKPVSRNETVKAALRTGGAIVIQVQVPQSRTDQDERFLKEVGETIAVTLKNYDPRTGQGEIGKLSFGYPDGFVIASESGLRIANASPMGCSGSFRLVEPGLLRGTIGCKWGSPYPTYEAIVRLGN